MERVCPGGLGAILLAEFGGFTERFDPRDGEFAGFTPEATGLAEPGTVGVGFKMFILGTGDPCVQISSESGLPPEPRYHVMFVDPMFSSRLSLWAG